MRLHTLASTCAYPSLPVPPATPFASLLANVRHGLTISPPPALSLPSATGAQSADLLLPPLPAHLWLAPQLILLAWGLPVCF